MQAHVLSAGSTGYPLGVAGPSHDSPIKTAHFINTGLHHAQRAPDPSRVENGIVVAAPEGLCWSSLGLQPEGGPNECLSVCPRRAQTAPDSSRVENGRGS